MTLPALLKSPAAILPVAMSCAALAVIAIHVAAFGTAREPDEGTSAHLWQLLMIAQLPLIGFFAVTQLQRNPKTALLVMAIQVGAALAAIAPVYYLNF